MRKPETMVRAQGTARLRTRRRRKPGLLLVVLLIQVWPTLSPGEARNGDGVAAAESCPPTPSGYDAGGTPGLSAPNDPLFSRQWGLTQINAPAAWERGIKGKGAVIALVDTGVDLGHPDLRGNLLPGVNLLQERDGCSRPQDDQGHGTFTAGIAVAQADNRIGIIGVAPDAHLIPIRASAFAKPPLGLSRGPIDQGIRYAADRAANVILVQAVTNLAPTQDPLDATDDEIAAAIAYAWSRGSTIIAPAVNAFGPACAYPAVAEFVICAAATDRDRNPATYSNLPVKSDLLAVRAPGGFGADRPPSPVCPDDRDVWSTGLLNGYCESTGRRGYNTASGTSGSAPHVAGVAAMLAGAGLGNYAIVDCLKQTSYNPITNTRGSYDAVYGWGIVDAGAAASVCVKPTS